MPITRPASRWTAWAQLFRLPNLFTVPGDPVTGATLVLGSITFGWPVALATFASLCIYLAGLAWNDYFDRDIDRIERPNRPLLSEAIRPRHAFIAANTFAITALFCCTLIHVQALTIGVVLTVLVFAYNRWLKHNITGMLAMGLCRGFSLLLGAIAVQPSLQFPMHVWVAFTIWTLYTTGVTALARHEADPARHVAPALIGHLIAGIVLLQILFIAYAAPSAHALTSSLVFAWVANRLLARRFYAS